MKKILFILVPFILIACGGGGGDDNGTTVTSIRLNNPTTTTNTNTNGQPPVSLVIGISNGPVEFSAQTK